MAKKKLTLSIDEDLLKEAKRISALEGNSLSSIVEEYFEGLVFEKWIKELCNDLSFKDIKPVIESEIPKNRPKGLEASKIIRELRDEQMRRIFNAKE
ncbi:MAG: DUF6364 family protein [Candidatus Verstraetearchaeota archaeon]|jgi:hypothetical protein|nr:DUF6364 family protein [Candidatus Verstraetearchaeota archaeon]